MACSTSSRSTPAAAPCSASLPRLRRGTHLGRPGVTHTRARTIRIATRGRSPVIADTTNVGDTVELSIAPRALDLVGAAA